jgi:hypothetical protein
LVDHRGCRVIKKTHQQIGAFEHQGAVLEMTAPDLTLGIGEAQMEMHTLGSQGALQGDDLKLAVEHRGLPPARALECRLRQIADNAQNKTRSALLAGELLEAAAHIAAGFEMK